MKNLFLGTLIALIPAVGMQVQAQQIEKDMSILPLRTELTFKDDVIGTKVLVGGSSKVEYTVYITGPAAQTVIDGVNSTKASGMAAIQGAQKTASDIQNDIVFKLDTTKQMIVLTGDRAKEIIDSSISEGQKFSDEYSAQILKKSENMYIETTALTYNSIDNAKNVLLSAKARAEVKANHVKGEATQVLNLADTEVQKELGIISNQTKELKTKLANLIQNLKKDTVAIADNMQAETTQVSQNASIMIRDKGVYAIAYGKGLLVELETIAAEKTDKSKALYNELVADTNAELLKVNTKSKRIYQVLESGTKDIIDQMIESGKKLYEQIRK